MPRRDLPLVKCRVLQQLAYCCALLEDTKSEMECCQRGLELCQDSRWTEEERGAMHECYCYFAAGLFQTLAKRGDVKDAVGYANLARKAAKDNKLMKYQIWIPVHLAFHEMACGSVKEANKHIAELHEVLQEHEAETACNVITAGRLYCALIESAVALQTGDLSAYRDESDSGNQHEGKDVIPMRMAEILTIVPSQATWTDPFGWMSLHELQGAILANFAAILAQKGRVTAGLDLVTKGLQLVTDPASSSNKTHEPAVSAAVKCSLLVSRARLHVLRHQVTEMQHGILEVMKLVDGQEPPLPRLRAVGHELIGLYLQTMGLHKLSVAHYRRALECEKTSTLGGRSFLIAALAEMSTHSKIGLSRASDLLHEVLEQNKQCQNEDALCALVSGLICDRQGSHTEARSCLYKALETTHRDDMPTELASSLRLAYIHSHFIEGNVGLVDEMLQRDFDSDINHMDPALALELQKVRVAMYEARQETTRVKQERELLRQKCEELKTVVHVALKRQSEHRRILKWDLK